MSAVLERAAREWEATRDRPDRILAELRQLHAELQALRHDVLIRGSEAVPVETAAALLGCKRTQVFSLLATGKLAPAPRVGRLRMITRESVDALLQVNAEAAKAPPRRMPLVYDRDAARALADEVRRLPLPKPASGHPGG